MYSKILKVFSSIYFCIGIISVVPILFTLGRLAIGGDVMIPFSAAAIEKYLYQWQAIQNGLYFSLNYLPLYIFYKLTEVFGFTVYQTSFFLLFIINFIAGLGVYKLTSLFYRLEEKIIYIASIIFYIFSPALLNGWHYMYFYACIPWFFYIIFKFIKNKKIEIIDVLWLGVTLFFSSLDLPNPKYLFYIFFSAVFIFFLSYLLGLIKTSFFLKEGKKLLILIPLSLYLALPLVYFATHYTPETYDVHTQSGYKDTGRMMDFGSATMEKMFRLHHDGINLNSVAREVYLSSSIITFFGYIFIAILVLNILSRNNRDENGRYNVVLLAASLAFIFFAIGPNPPFGLLYEYFVRNFPLFAFLRTTAGAVFILSLFCALAIFLFLRSLPRYRKASSLAMIFVILVVSYPLVNGEFFRNNDSVSKYVDDKQYGLRIPEDYFKMKSIVDKNLLDAKFLVPKMGASYISTTWGYFGPLLYNFIYKGNFISPEKIYTSIYNHNVGFIFQDSSLVNINDASDLLNTDRSQLLLQSGMLSLYSINPIDFVPHFYVPGTVRISHQNVGMAARVLSSEVVSRPTEVTFYRDQPNLYTPEVTDVMGDDSHEQIVEFKKVNSTKYRVRIHFAQGIFPLVFSEQFNPSWKIYPVSHNSRDFESVERNLAQYKVLDGNALSQASHVELTDYLKKGWITSLGDGKEKKRAHKTWNGREEELDYYEKYSVDFISKISQGTIQNNNLHTGYFWDTWFLDPLQETGNHLVANGFANSWVIDTEKICSSESYSVDNQDNQSVCIKNADGTYSFEMIVEFFPQQIYYGASLISIITLVFCCGYLVFIRLKSSFLIHDRR